MSVADFYDALAPVYHLIFPDWDASIARQGQALDSIIRAATELSPRSVLDASCGIGTQSLGLARLGYDVTASDISPAAVARAHGEAERRALSIRTSVVDMRYLFQHHRRSFDVVIACDNSLPHLLSDGEIRDALVEFYRCTSPGGICLVSSRDYAAIDLSGLQLHPYGVQQNGSTRHILFQVWECRPPLYDTTFYVVRHEEGLDATVTAVRTTYYAITVERLGKLMEQAGFSRVERFDGPYFQPVLVGHRE